MIKYFNWAFRLGSTLLVYLLLGVFVGMYIDGLVKRFPLFTVISTFLGIFSGLRSIYISLKDKG